MRHSGEGRSIMSDKIGISGSMRKDSAVAPCHPGVYLVSPGPSTGAAMAELVDALA